MTRSHSITPPILARWLRVDYRTVYSWIESGELPAMNIGTRGKAPRFRIYRKDLIAFLERRGMSATAVADLVQF